MIDILFDALKGVVWLLWEALQFLFVDLLVKPMKARSEPPVPGATLEEALVAIDPCRRGHGSAGYYHLIAERVIEVATSVGAKSDRQCAAVVQQTLEEYGCEASRMDTRLSARALATHRRIR